MKYLNLYANYQIQSQITAQITDHFAQIQNHIKLDSTRRFSHRRCPSPPIGTQWYRLLLLAAYGLATAHTLLCIVTDDDSAVCFFVPYDLDLWPLTLVFELGRDFCTAMLRRWIIATFVIYKIQKVSTFCSMKTGPSNYNSTSKQQWKTRYNACSHSLPVRDPTTQY